MNSCLTLNFVYRRIKKVIQFKNWALVKGKPNTEIISFNEIEICYSCFIYAF